ncbi:CD276 antigen homolog [Onychostoma macrolepis]|uniref:Ig-like domain-containing protein n=1 Tax=Onychostoma macrolepis TaxID=369639 RepID=A0A7J6BU61_9TELE|nr:CD276 antigen homolog [Onychostoma macrolepis]KAF4097855.1 hypothetical protein G5714_021863 [Onychostoma macrolepis]
MIIRWCFICVFAVLINKVCLQVTGFIGGSVVLPCSLTQHDLKPQDINVLWRDKDSETIYDLVEGEDSLESQDPRYKNRVQTFPKEYVRGNFSLKLKNLTHADAGEFTCFITHTSYSKHETVQLLINKSTVKPGNQSTEEEKHVPETQSGQMTILLICLCTLLPLIILTPIIMYFIFYWRKKSQAAL